MSWLDGRHQDECPTENHDDWRNPRTRLHMQPTRTEQPMNTPRVWQTLAAIPAEIDRVHDGWRGHIIYRIPEGWANPELLTAVPPFTELNEE